jgi:pimeloyl-ACP methyl ester carboxylesterase
MNTRSLCFYDSPRGRKIVYCKGLGQYNRNSDILKHGIVFLGGYCSNLNGIKASWLSQRAESRGWPYLRFDYTGHGQSSGNFREATLLIGYGMLTICLRA